jgi:hypothetical protein
MERSGVNQRVGFLQKSVRKLVLNTGLYEN